MQTTRAHDEMAARAEASVRDDTPKNTGFEEEKGPVKDPPQYTIESADIVVPDAGLKKGLPFQFKGKVRRLENVQPANAKISAQALYRYKDNEQAAGNPLIVEIDKETLEFEGSIEEIYEPNAYYFDKEKPADAKYKLLVKLRGGCIDKDVFSKEVELPMATKTYILKNSCYDSTWSGIKSEPSKYPASGDNVFPNDTIKKVQALLIKLRFLKNKMIEMPQIKIGEMLACEIADGKAVAG